MARKIEFQLGFAIDKTQLGDLQQTLRQIQKEAENAAGTGTLSTQLDKAAQEAQKLEHILNQSWNSKLNQFDISRFTNQIKKGYTSVEEFKKSWESLGRGDVFNQAQSSILGMNLQLKQSSKLLDDIAQTMANTVRFGLASSVFNRMSDGLQSAYNYSIKLNSSLNDIRIVSDKSAEDMEKFAVQANKAAKALGASTLDYTKASTIYYQQGLGDEEVAARAETTLKAANVTGQTGDEVSEQLTAIWNGYKVSAEESEMYIDKVAKVAAATAADLEELSTGMSKTASAANAMGVDFDNLNAMLATVISVTREAPETIGTSFRSIFSRMSQLEADGTDEFGVTLSEVTAKMQAMGVEILDQNGALKDMDDILSDVASKWNDWSKGQQVAAARVMAGTQQYSRFIALMDNQNMWNQALEDSKNALGELDKENDIYLESTKAHLQQLSTEAERTYNTLFDTNAVNSMSDAVTGLLSVFNNYLDTLGGGLSSITNLGLIAGNVFNKQIGSGINKMINNRIMGKNNEKNAQAAVEVASIDVSRVGGSDYETDAYERELEYSRQILDISKDISTEKYNELTNIKHSLAQMELQNAAIYEYEEQLSKNSKYDESLSRQLKEQVSRVEELKAVQRSLLPTYKEIDALLESGVQYEEEQVDLKKQQEQILSEIEKLSVKGYITEGSTQDKSYFELLDDFSRPDSTVDENKIAAAKKIIIDLLDEEIAKEEKLNRLKAAEGIVNDSSKRNQLEEDIKSTENKINSMLDDEKRSIYIQKAIEGFTSLFAVIQQGIGIISTLNDDSLSGWEKFENIGSTLLITIPMLISNFSAMKGAMTSLALAMNITTVTTKTGFLEATGAVLTFQTALGPLWLVILGITAAATALIVVVKGVSDAYNKDANAAKAAAKETQKLKETYEETKKASDDLKSTLEEYQNALKNIESLTEGTTEFKQAIIEANAKALELLETNKELAKYATRDSKTGLITISDEGMDKILEQQTDKMQKAQFAYVQSALNSSRLQDISDMTDFQRQYTYSNNQTGAQKSSSLGQYGQGNIDLYNRPIYKQSDGSISTVESVSFWSDEENKEILVPLIQQIGDDVVEVTAEEAQKIYEETGQYLGKFENAAEANIYAAKLHEAQDYYYNGNNGKSSFTKQQVPKEILQSIADYMSRNGIEKLIPDDLAKIDAVASTSSDLQQAILDQIDAYSEMGVQLSQTKEKQRLLADECAAAYLELHGIKDENLKQDGNKEVVEHLFAQYLNNAEQKEEDIKKNTNQYTQDINKKYIDIAGTSAYSNGVTPGMIAGGLDTAKAYAKAMGYDENNIGHGGFLWKDYIFYNDKGEEQSRISSDDIATKYGEVLTNEAYQKAAEEAAKVVIKSVDDLINNKDLNNLDSYDATLSQLFKSGESGQLTAKSNIMSQQQAKDLLNEDTFNTLAEQINNSDFWQRQGFESAEQYIEAFKSWLQDRSNISDVTALGADAIKNMNKTSESVIDQFQEGKITSKNANDNTDYKQLASYANELKALYPELTVAADTFNNTNLIGTQEWTEALYQLEDKINELNLNRLVETANKAYDDLQEEINKFKDENGEIDIEALLDSDDFMTDLDALINADYAVDVEIHAQAEDAFESFENASKNLAEQAQKIGEKFIVSASDIRELNNAFPGIINGMKDVGDGTVQLSEQTVQSAMSAAQGELAASAQSTLGQLENQAKVLRSKQKIYQGMYEAANALAKGEGDLEENKAIIAKGFDELKAENNKEVTEQEQSNAQLVATDSNTQARILASNWNEAYESAADSAIAFANTAVSASQVAQAGEGTVSKGNFGVNYTGQNGQSSEAAKLATLQEAFDSGDTNYAKMAESFKQAANALGSQANDIEGMIAQIGATTIEGTKGLQNVSKGKGYSPSKSSKSGNDPDKMDKLEDEKDIYHDIDIILQQISTDLNRLQKQQDKLFGQDLIDNLNQQLSKTDAQINATRQKIQIAQGEASRLQGLLAQQGVTFNSDGTISNYESIYTSQLNYVNSLIAQYNSMSKESQESFKDTVEAAKKNFETLKNNIDKYDEVITETIPGLEDDIQDAIDQEIQINITKFNMEIEIRLDLKEAELEWNEFKKKIIDGIKDEDILGTAQARLRDFDAYYKNDNTGIIQAGTKQVTNILSELTKMDNTGWSDVYGDNRQQALEDLQTYYKQLISDLEEVAEIQEDIHQAYLNMLDEAQEKFDEQINTYEQITKLIEHDTNLIQLVYGDESYSKLTEFYEKQQENYNKQLDFQRQQKDFWYQQMLTAEEGTEEWEKARDNWMQAVDDWRTLVEDAVQNITDKYVNAINKIFQELNNQVTNGKGLDYIDEQWTLINKNADQYLDTINSMYGIQKLENKYLDAIDKTDSVSAQRKLNDLMKQEVAALEEKDKLTQYDVDRANKKYEIALKQIALEEAQQNKSTMRLRRDSQGNYSYQFVSDQDEIGNLKDELQDLYNQLYNFDLDAYKENLDSLLSAWTEYQEKMAEAAQINDPVQRAEKEALIQEQYGDLINGLVEQNETLRLNLHESAFTELADLYDIDVSNFQKMTDDEKDILLSDMIPYWTSGVQDMAKVFADDEEGFTGVCKKALEDLDEATKNYTDSLEEVEQVGDISFDTIANGTDQAIDKTEALLQNNKDLIDNYYKQIDAIRSVAAEVDKLITKYDMARQAAIAASEAAYKYQQEQNRQAAEAAAREQAKNSSSRNSNNRKSSSRGNDTRNSGRNNGGKNSGRGKSSGKNSKRRPR